MGWGVALHGGAGDIPRDLLPELCQLREACLQRCLNIAIDGISAHKSPLDVVELVVCILLFSSVCFFLMLFFLAFIFCFR